MCFIIPSTQKKAKIAKKDMTCYKTVDKIRKGNYRSYYQHFRYNDGYEYANDNFIVERKNYPSRHTYMDIVYSEGQGIHSYINIPKSPFPVTVIECHIPKGAYYFSNRERGEYFSDRLVIVGEVKK